MDNQELTDFLAGCCQMKSKGPILWLKLKKKELTKEVLSTIINLGKIANKNKGEMSYKQLARNIIKQELYTNPEVTICGESVKYVSHDISFDSSV